MSATSRIVMFGAAAAILAGAYIGFGALNEDATAVSEDAQVVLNRGNGSEPSSLDPHRASGTWENNIIGDMFLGLYTEDADGIPIYGAAENHTVSDDGLVHTFTIREGHVWSDGAPVTAYDFEFALRRILDPVMAAEYAALLYVIVNAREINSGTITDLTQLGARALDARTLEITLTVPAPYLPQLLTHYTAFPVPQHVVEEHGERWVRAGNMVSNGPYVLQNWTPNDHITLTKNELFFDAGNVAIDVVNFYPTDDSSAALRRFRAGEIDLNTDFPSQQYDWLQENLGAETRVAEYISTSYIAVNTSVPPFDDVRVRQALAMVIDRETIANQILRTGQVPAYSLVPPSMPNYDAPQATFVSLSYNDRVAMAQDLMREAGFGPDSPLRFTYRYRESIENRRAAIATAGMWNQYLYTQVDLVNTEVAIHYADLRTGNFEMADAGWTADYADPENYLFLVDSRSGQLNYGHYANPEYDALLDQARLETDLELRADILNAAERIFLNDLPLIPTTFGVSKNLVATRVLGWQDNLVDVHRTRFLSFANDEAPSS